MRITPRVCTSVLSLLLHFIERINAQHNNNNSNNNNSNNNNSIIIYRNSLNFRLVNFRMKKFYIRVKFFA